MHYQNSENITLEKWLAFHAIALLFAVFNISALEINGISHIVPTLDLAIIFYFTVFRDEFSVWFIFLLGIFNDALSGNPLGTTAICYIALTKIFQLLNRKLVIRENFLQILQQFIVFILLFFICKILILSAFNSNEYDTKVVILQTVITTLSYIVMHKIFDFIIEGKSNSL